MLAVELLGEGLRLGLVLKELSCRVNRPLLLLSPPAAMVGIATGFVSPATPRFADGGVGLESLALPDVDASLALFSSLFSGLAMGEGFTFRRRRSRRG